MRTRPQGVQLARISGRLADAHGLSVQRLIFLPLGEASWIYQAETPGGPLLVKLTKRRPDVSALLVPDYLSRRGQTFVIPPMRTKRARLWSSLDGFGLVVYDFVARTSAYRRELSRHRWTEIGNIMRMLHSTPLPAALKTALRKEAYVPRYLRGARRVFASALSYKARDHTGRGLAQFIKARAEQIREILTRGSALGRQLRGEHLPYVLCHGDPNRANIHIADDGRVLLLDWDDAMLAPRERDLMFFVDSRAEKSFMAGYDPEGRIAANRLAIAFYRYDWVIQEISDFGKRVLFGNLDKRARTHALRKFRQLFDHSDVVDAAERALAQATVSSSAPCP